MMESMVVGDSQKNAVGGRRLSSIDGNETNFSCASYRRFNSLDEMPTLADICDRYDSSSHPGVASSDFVKRTPNACSRPRSRSLIGAPAPASSLGDNPSSPVGSSSSVRGMLPALGGSAGPILASDRYKTELCRSFAETGGNCRYGDRCQFAHGPAELRSVDRHPRYKTELCRTFHSRGFCAYGPRCHFIHNIDETRVLPSNVLEQMIAQRQLADMLLIAQIAATSSSSPEILQPQSPSPVSFTSPLNASAATAAIHRRYSLDNYSASVTSAASDSANGCAPSYFRRVAASTTTPSAPSSDGVSPSWSSHRNILSQLSSSCAAAAAAAASEAELFRARSMSLGSAASRSIDGCSGTSSPGPSSPTSFGGLTIAGLRNGGAPMTVQSAIAAFTADCRGWLDSSSSSPSSSPSVPDSPTSNVGLPDAWSPFNPWCRGSSGSRRNYTDSFDVRGEKFGVTTAGHTNSLAAGCVGAPGRIPMWPIS